MVAVKIVVYGTRWCGDCYQTRHFLDRHAITYDWVDIDRDRAGEEQVLKINRGMRSVPTVVFEDGSILVEPSTLALAKKLGVS